MIGNVYTKASTLKPRHWTTPSTPVKLLEYSDVEVQFVGTITTPYQPQRSLDGTNFANCVAYGADGTAYTTITVPGFYSFDGYGVLKFSAGAGATLTLRAAA